MQSAKITFSNNTFLTLTEGEHLIPIGKYEHDGEILTSMQKSYELWNHIHDGLIPSVTELLCRCEFFKQLESDIIYKSSAVVSIENL